MSSVYKNRAFRINLINETMIITKRPKKYAIMAEVIGSGDVHHTFLAAGVGTRVFHFCVVQFLKYEDAKLWFTDNATKWVPVCRLDSETLGQIRDLIFENPQADLPEIPEIVGHCEVEIERDDITPRNTRIVE